MLRPKKHGNEMIRELKPDEFDETWSAVLLAGYDRFKRRREFTKPGEPDGEHFLTTWRKLMNIGMARTWVGKDAVLGGLIVPDLFTGVKSATVVFWDKLPGGEAVGLLTAFEAVAREAGCEGLYMGVLDNDDREHMRVKVRSIGFKKAEEIFVKFL